MIFLSKDKIEQKSIVTSGSGSQVLILSPEYDIAKEFSSNMSSDFPVRIVHPETNDLEWRLATYTLSTPDDVFIWNDHICHDKSCRP